MITIFTIPKSFQDNISITQRNAIKSWLQLDPKPEIILFGDDDGVAGVAKEFGVLNIPDIKKNEFGTPFLNSAFEQAQKIARSDILVYINADIILMSDFIPAVQKVKKDFFLMSGRRWDIDINEEINFEEKDWENRLRKKVEKEGKLHGFSGIDYFVFPRKLVDRLSLPSFAVGRPGWDNWLIYKARTLRISVINATKAITIIHQNHNYSHIKSGIRDKNPEADRNFRLIGDFSKMMTLRDADWLLTEKGIQRPSFSGRIFSILSLFYPWRLMFAVKRKLQKLL